MRINIFRRSRSEIMKKGLFLLNLTSLHDKIQKYQIFPIYPSVFPDTEVYKIKNKDKNRPKPIVIIGTRVNIKCVYIGILYFYWKDGMFWFIVNELILRWLKCAANTDCTCCFFGEIKTEAKEYRLMYITAFCLI